MSASKKMRELMRARIEHDKSRLMATFAESRKEMVSRVDSALAGKVDELMQQLASRDAEILQLQKLADEVHAARKVNAEHDRLLVKIAAKDAEIAELVAALELLSKYIAYNGDDWVQRTALEALDAAIDAAIRARGEVK